MSCAYDDGWQLVRYGRRGHSHQQLPFLNSRVRRGRRYRGVERASPVPPMGEQDPFPSPNHRRLKLLDYFELERDFEDLPF